MRFGMIAAMALLASCGATAADFSVQAGDVELDLTDGVITRLADAEGNVFAQADEGRERTCLLRLDGSNVPTDSGLSGQAARLPLALRFGVFQGDGPAELDMALSCDEDNGELIVEQSGKAAAGLHGVQLGIAGIPLEYEIIIPGRSGVRLDRTTAGGTYRFPYPMAWEAQFVIVQGEEAGFYVWAEDVKGRYKELVVYKRGDGWDLGLATVNNAPFEELTEIEGVRWRIGVHGAQWQEPAGRYRQWAREKFGLTAIADQQPGWVNDMRLLVICGMGLDLLDALAAKVDPAQTILYVPSWRRDGYDMNYPDYTALPELEPFMEKAHELGFRVMLHVNYFGCDPKNPLYEKFETFHARDPYSKEKLWWEWPFPHKREPGEEPRIKFAYINPACEEWRELFVERMVELCGKYEVDALHLDQTLCIWNHAGGLVDGMTMLEGNIAEHEALREALPQVALSGEGLNEATFRHEAFAQRHAWGLNHSEGTYDRNWLMKAHPVASYLFRPHTIINGYLGMCAPGQDQLYAAWMQAYTQWGTIPTLRVGGPGELEKPARFGEQLLDEIAFFQGRRVDPDIEAAWGGDTIFPYRAADGTAVRYVQDNGFALVAGDEVISRTLTGVTEFVGKGTVPGWPVYDDERIFALDPEAWHPLLARERSMTDFHVSYLPEGVVTTQVTHTPDITVVGTEDAQRVVAWMGDLIADARIGYTVFGAGDEQQERGIDEGDSGAFVRVSARDLIQLHPPWKAQRTNPATGVLEAGGTGEVFAEMQLALPDATELRFLGDVHMDKGAVGEGKTDGVTYTVEARAGETKLRAQVHAATTEPVPLTLDLSELRGKTVTLRMAADPGSKRQATFDWARWANARIEKSRRFEGALRLVSPESWEQVISSSGEAEVERLGGDAYEITTEFPTTVFMLSQAPTAVSAGMNMREVPFVRGFFSDTGMVLENPQYGAANLGENTVGEVTREGFFTHPPDHGSTVMYFPVTLPEEAIALRAWVGLRDGSKSDGCRFVVGVNGEPVAEELIEPGDWHGIAADLSAWAGKTIVLSLTTDSAGSHYFDWACWGDVLLQ